MGKSRKLLLPAAMISLILAMAVGTGVSVGQDSYPVGDVTVSPGKAACIGQTITLSGTGAPANATVYVGLASTAYSMQRGTQGGYAVDFGSVMADAAGNWSLTATVPATATVNYGGNPAEPPGTTAAIRNGSTWWVEASDHSTYTSLGELDIYDCSVTLPSTGFPMSDTATAVVLVLAGGLGLGAWRARRGG